MPSDFLERVRESKENPDNKTVVKEAAEENSEEQKNSETENTENQNENTKEKSGEESKETKIFDITTVNEHFGTEFQDENSLKSLIESQQKFKDFESQLTAKDQELQTANEKYTSLLDSVDIEKVVPNKEVVAISQLAEKYPDADIGILSAIRNTDLKSLNKLEALVLIDKLTVPGNIPDSIRKKEILRSLGIEEEDEQLSQSDMYRIERAYSKEAKILNEIKSFQPELKQFDFESEKKQREQKKTDDINSLKTYNEKALKILFDGYKETKSPYKEDGKSYSYDFIVDKEFKDEFFEKILNDVVNSGLKITTENQGKIAQYIDDQFFLARRDKIIHDAVKQAVSKEREKNHKETHNDSETNKTEAPPGSVKAQKTIREAYRAGEIKR